MTITIPEGKHDLLSREKKAFANLALVLSDGSPQVTPIWFDWDGEHIIINTARGRVKDKVLKKHPRVALDIIDPENPYHYLLIRGRVTDETEEGGYEQISSLNVKYHGNPNYPRHPGEVRVTYRITPDRIF
ncbi:MAG: PPOX class F420-dependent oxidoreductase [Anaerolineae bacterium]